MIKEHIVFLPGWSGTKKAWAFQEKALSDIASSSVFVLTKEDSINHMAQVVLENAENEFILIGHSLGGLTAQLIAILAPERVKKLILLATWAGDTATDTRKYFEGLYPLIQSNNLSKAMDELRKWNISPNLKDHSCLQIFKEMQDGFPLQGYFNQTKALLESPLMMPLLSKIIAPTLIIEGQDDPCFTMEQQMRLVNGIKHSVFTLIPNCGHMLTLEQPEAVCSLVRLWITMSR